MDTRAEGCSDRVDGTGLANGTDRRNELPLLVDATSRWPASSPAKPDTKSCPIPVFFRMPGRKPTPSSSTQSFNSSLRTSKATSTRPDLPLGKACLIAFVTSSLTIRPSDGDPLIPDAATAKARMIGLCQEGTSCGSPTSTKAESRWR